MYSSSLVFGILTIMIGQLQSEYGLGNRHITIPLSCAISFWTHYCLHNQPHILPWERQAAHEERPIPLENRNSPFYGSRFFPIAQAARYLARLLSTCRSQAQPTSVNVNNTQRITSGCRHHDVKLARHGHHGGGGHKLHAGLVRVGQIPGKDPGQVAVHAQGDV
jgi:hypothetical protein